MDKEVARVTRHGVEITVFQYDDHGDQRYEVCFGNAPGNFDNLHHVKPIRGRASKEDALAAGQKFVDDRQWQYVRHIGPFAVHVRLWFDERWGFRIRTEGMSDNRLASSNSREVAEAEGLALAEAEVKYLDELIQRTRAARS